MRGTRKRFTELYGLKLSPSGKALLCAVPEDGSQMDALSAFSPAGEVKGRPLGLLIVAQWIVDEWRRREFGQAKHAEESDWGVNEPTSARPATAKCCPSPRNLCRKLALGASA